MRINEIKNETDGIKKGEVKIEQWDLFVMVFILVNLI